MAAGALQVLQSEGLAGCGQALEKCAACSIAVNRTARDLGMAGTRLMSVRQGLEAGPARYLWVVKGQTQGRPHAF